MADNSTLVPRGSPGHDRLGKVPPVLSRLCEGFASLYDPSKHLSADEAMIIFQGRSFLKQYMPMKPVKRGIKVWVIADSTAGCFSRVEYIVVYNCHIQCLFHGILYIMFIMYIHRGDSLSSLQMSMQQHGWIDES